MMFHSRVTTGEWFGPEPNRGLKSVTILSMILAIFAVRLLEVMFFVGLAGSAVVVLISFIEDFKELVGEE